LFILFIVLEQGLPFDLQDITPLRNIHVPQNQIAANFLILPQTFRDGSTKSLSASLFLFNQLSFFSGTFTAPHFLVFFLLTLIQTLDEICSFDSHKASPKKIFIGLSLTLIFSEGFATDQVHILFSLSFFLRLFEKLLPHQTLPKTFGLSLGLPPQS
jgi:hypothetical protein